MAATQMLNSGTLDEESFRLLEQLTSRTRHRPTAAVSGSGSSPGTVRQPAPPEMTRTEAETAEERAMERSEAKSNPSDRSDEFAEAGVILGSLRAAQEDKWTCKVPSCTGSFHHLKDCKIFHSMEPEDRVKLVEHHELCLGCLTPGHGRAARSCPYKEERADACQRTRCKARHHRLLHLDKCKAKASSGGGPLTQSPSLLADPTPTEEPVVAQWVSTKGGVPFLVFWDTGSQVTLITYKATHALGLPAIPGSPLRLEGIGEVTGQGLQPTSRCHWSTPEEG
jgi:hypothetical protein